MDQIFEIIKEQKMFSDIIESLHNGVVVIDENKKVLYANSYVKKIFDIGSISDIPEVDTSILGNFLNCQYDCVNCAGCKLDSDIKSLINICCSSKINESYQFIERNKQIKYFKYSILPISNNGKKQFFITFDDITWEKELYKELEIKHFRLKQLAESLENSDSIVLAIAKSVEAKDKLTKGHISRVAYFSEQIGKHLGFTETELEILKKGSILHDIGKIGTPDHILNKPGPLTPEEFDVMKKHPADGWEILKSMKTFSEVAKIVRHHHEKLDGSGYPDGIKADNIDIATRIVAIVDIYDALIAERPYKKPFSREEALNIIYKDVDNGKLDRNIADALADVTLKTSFMFSYFRQNKVK